MNKGTAWAAVGALIGLVVLMAAWGVWALMKHPDETAAISPETVADYVHAVLEANRTVYTLHVVDKMHEKGIVEAAEGWRQENALPLPAQFLIETGRLVAQQGRGIKYRLVSLWPIYVWNLPATEFEKKGLEQVVQNPNKPVTGFVRIGRERFFQAIYADRAVSQACVSCHNAHPNSPRRDFKLNDVMGGIVITIPLEQ